MHLKSIVYEDFVQYKKPSLFLGTCYCDFKCEKESKKDCHCQNSRAYQEEIVECDDDRLTDSYLKNRLTRAVVIGGFEPMLQFDEVIHFIETFRKKCDDDIVIYTGYRKDEIYEKIKRLKEYDNIILKVGRYIPDRPPVKDPVLGVVLASDNQYAFHL